VNCPICQNTSLFYQSTFHWKKRDFYCCQRCGFRFVSSETMLTNRDEEDRYQQHNNSLNDSDYRNYLQKLIQPLMDQLPLMENGIHLDFGSGKAPLVSELFKEKNWHSEFYDVYFYPEVPKKQYDIVTSIEVVEHFRDALPNWQELVSLVKPQGLLLVNTQIYHHELDPDKDKEKFQHWWYKNDPTHVSIYTDITLNELEKMFNLERIYFDNIKTIIWRKRS